MQICSNPRTAPIALALGAMLTCAACLSAAPLRAAQDPQPPPDTLSMALEWLAQHQEPDGHWDSVKNGAAKNDRCDTAATGLAVLAFLSAGITDRRGEYKDNVKRALEWIIKQQNTEGGIMPGANGKEAGMDAETTHAICGMALAECFGMSHAPTVKEAAQKAIEYSAHVLQHGKGVDLTGWGGDKKSPGETEITVWFVAHLKCARLAGLAVPQESFQGAIVFLDQMELKDNPKDPTGGHHYKNSNADTQSAPLPTVSGCWARMLMGWPTDELRPAITWAVDKKGLPAWGDKGEKFDWTYFYMGMRLASNCSGTLWERWNSVRSQLLVSHQCQTGDAKGSWDTSAGAGDRGQVVSTAFGVLCLEVSHYVPLYGPSQADSTPSKTP
ncbi:MAG: prenyltransferase/squalene oxidase repeat-containing protein [Planctomycetota bacterium]